MKELVNALNECKNLHELSNFAEIYSLQFINGETFDNVRRNLLAQLQPIVKRALEIVREPTDSIKPDYSSDTVKIRANELTVLA